MPLSSCNIKIPVPYGYLEVKVWGSKRPQGQKVIALHGWQDNAGTFDELIPLLDDELYVVAVDLSGHGLSSHLPHGIPYFESTWACDLKRVIDFLRLDKVSIIGHSMGGHVGFYFASLFPEYVDKIIALDAIKPRTVAESDIARLTAEAILQFFSYDDRYLDEKPTYNYDEAVDILKWSHTDAGTVTDGGARCLIKRAARQTAGGYVFTRDNRLHCIPPTKIDLRTLKVIYKNLSCAMLIIKARNKPTSVNLNLPEHREMFDFFKEQCRTLDYVEVDGDHYVHLTSPKNVAPIINEFIRRSAVTNISA